MSRRRLTKAEQAQTVALVEVLQSTPGQPLPERAAAPRVPTGRVPTGELDRVLTVAVDRTARPPLLLITTLRRSPSDVSDDAFRPVHTITLQVQYAELLLERIREAVTPPSRPRRDSATL